MDKKYIKRPQYKWGEKNRQKLIAVFNTPEYKAKISGQNHPNWKGGVSKSGLTSYDNYADRLSTHVEIRRDPSNFYILQLKCAKCNKWFSPKKVSVKKHMTKYHHYRFHCSSTCAHAGSRKRRCISITSYMNKEIIKQIKQDKENKKQKEKELRKLKRDQIRNQKLKEKERRSELLRKRKEFKEKYPETVKRQIAVNCHWWWENLRKNNPLRWRAKRLIAGAKQRAKEKGWDFDLDEKWYIYRANHFCPVTGIVFDNSLEGTYKLMNPYAASIDRIDSNKGYLKSNCRLIIWAFNNANGEYTDEIVYRVLKAFVKNFEAFKQSDDHDVFLVLV